MKVSLLIGTVKGAFLMESDGERRSWSVRGPLFKGWKVTAFGRDLEGGYLAATASEVYGPAIHKSADLDEWRQIERSPAYSGESGFKLNQIWTFSRAGQRLLAGVDEAGLFASDDGGETWSLLPGLTSLPSRASWFPGFGGLCAHALSADPANPERLWVGMSAVGVFRSDDAGESWTSVNDGVPATIEDKDHGDIGYCVHALAFDPKDAKRIWRMDHKGMFRTRDGGEQWERIENGLPSSFGFPLVIDPRTKALFAVPLESDEYRMPVDGKLRVYRSRDEGDSWEVLGDGLPDSPVYTGVLRGAMATDGLDPCGVYFATTSGGVYASRDAGETWSELPAQLPRVLSVEAWTEA
jgi:photosystem II stability/assembly factor-like uncharacterized protein